ncbi:polysaccharide pyruvyl transferase family protein [Kitasatospora sp. CM 4170]|uniref:Polysaccharide pyruvyl transferase family protein n=1 Tax=Kitasatospora aburaviensis TaxID=67265 RepID=A0ABW1EZT6_9ACTN|nr:polysaccharide pyruvyl transferase family protein [Kitasatospora sp. CM 4170]WNM43485.1 polysaccharide pyruvyl transferase family protein [Kitasatospora sp. CM 4170]
MVEPASRCALLGFPRYGNVGDSAIWLGVRALLGELGVEVVYTADHHDFSAEALAARLPSGTILLTGGGNLGDLWPSHQRARERAISAFPGHRIIQLPQSVHFGDPADLHRARAVFDAHPDLVLLLRDERSLRLARRAFRAPSVLAPDCAFAMNGLPRLVRPERRILWLRRGDHESAAHGEPDNAGPVAAVGVYRTDWTGEEGADAAWATSARTVRRQIEAASAAVRSTASSEAVAELTDAQDRHAELQLRRGCRLLGSAEAVVTDRLHGHLLSLLLGLPHVVVDDRHGKISGYWQTWEHDRHRAVARRAPDADQALRTAAALLAAPATPRPARESRPVDTP